MRARAGWLALAITLIATPPAIAGSADPTKDTTGPAGSLDSTNGPSDAEIEATDPCAEVTVPAETCELIDQIDSAMEGLEDEAPGAPVGTGPLPIGGGADCDAEVEACDPDKPKTCDPAIETCDPTQNDCDAIPTPAHCQLSSLQSFDTPDKYALQMARNSGGKGGRGSLAGNLIARLRSVLTSTEALLGPTGAEATGVPDGVNDQSDDSIASVFKDVSSLVSNHPIIAALVLLVALGLGVDVARRRSGALDPHLAP